MIANRHLPFNRWLGLLLGLCLMIFTVPASGQDKSKTQLEKEKEENLRKIKEAQQILDQTATEKKATLGQLSALKQQIVVREDLIQSINKELELLREEINDIELLLSALEQDLKNLKKEYEAMLFSAQKATQSHGRLAYLFSSESFNQFFRRLQYMEQYGEARRNQVEKIRLVQRTLALQKQDVLAKSEEKNKLLNEQIQENTKLLGLRNEQRTLVTQLSHQEKELKKEVDDRKRAIANLDKLIAEIVREELARKEKSSSKAYSTTPEAVNLSASFSENRRKLLWPVEKGFISGKFGKHPHPVLKGITVDNQGVDIQTNKDESVRAVFNGRVSKVAFVPGMGSIVILQHGEYFTVYAKLKRASVKAGETVNARDVIGEVYTDRDGVSEVQFQVWKNSTKLNPEEWLAGK